MTHDPPRTVPTAPGRPIVGALYDMMADRGRFLIEGHAQHGDTFRTRIFGRDLWFTRDPALVQVVNVTHAQSFNKPLSVKLMWEPFLGNGLVPNDGPHWKRQHKLVMPGFHKQRVDAYAETMVAFTERLLAEWVPGQARDVRADLLELTLGIVAKTLFDLDIAEADAGAIHASIVDLSRILVADSDRLVPRPRWWPTKENRRKYEAIAAVEAIIWRELAERRAQRRHRGDLFSHMAFVQDEQGGMSDKELRDEAMTLIFAGHETTARADVDLVPAGQAPRRGRAPARRAGDEPGARHQAAALRAEPGGWVRAGLHHRAVAAPRRAGLADARTAGRRRRLSLSARRR